jgi:glycosyltransferase involved in cell wall biosynthesis
VSTKPTVCLTMIVRNEGAILKRCLDSAKPWIDGYFIIDTGSTDDTMDIIRTELADYPGTLLEEEWVNFGHNRSSLVAQAREAGYDYLLLADADHVFVGEPGALDNLVAPSYLIQLTGGFEYWMPYLVRSDLHWRYHGVTHEFLTAPESFINTQLPGFTIDHRSDGGNRPEKFTQDRRLLEAEYEKNPNDDRTVFYLAQTCRDMGDIERAVELYRHRATLGGWDEEVYWALFQVGELTGEVEDYLRAWEYRPGRPEAIHRLARTYNEKGLHRSAYLIASMGRSVWYPSPCGDILFLERWAEEFGIPFERSIAAWWIGHHDESIQGFRDLLACPDLPDAFREMCEHNLRACGVTQESST